MLWIINLIFTIYLVLVCLCVMLRSAGADYHNPIIQTLLKVTNPVLKPLRAFIPDISRFDSGGFVGAIIIKFIQLAIIFALTNLNFGIIGMIIISVVMIIKLIFDIWFYAIIIQAILSWFNPGNTSMLHVLLSLNRPILSLFQRFIPSISGMDFSPLVAIIVLQVLNYLVLNFLLQVGVSLI